MTTILDFVKISKINGVARYSLVSGQGKRLAGNHNEAEPFYRELAQLGRDAATTRSRDGMGPLTAMTLTAENDALIVVPVGQFVLGVTPDADLPTPKVIHEVLLFLDRIRHQHTVSQKS